MNAYAVYKVDFGANRKDAEEKPTSRKVCIKKIAEELMAEPPKNTNTKKRKAADGVDGEKKWVCRGQDFCVVVRDDGKKRKHPPRIDCALCKVKSRYECKGCGFGLHPDCWEKWHKERTVPPDKTE